MSSNSNGTPKWIIYVGGIASIATIIGVIIAYNNYVHPPTPITPTPTVPFVPITLTAPLPTSTPLPSINTAQDIYMQFTDAGIAMGDEGNVPTSWWYQCCKYSPGKGSLSFIDVASGGKMVIALFSTSNAM